MSATVHSGETVRSQTSAQTLQSCPSAQTNPSLTLFLFANPFQYAIKQSLKTFNTNNNSQEMIVVNSNKSALSNMALTLFRLLGRIQR